MRRNNTLKRKGNKTCSLIVDGETEIWYFQMMKNHEAMRNVSIKPELPKKKKLKDQYKLVVENSSNYDRVIWIVDFDTIIKEDNETRGGKRSVLQCFKDYLKNLEEINNVDVLVNTPCLEFWYLLHLKETGRYYSSCDDIIKQFRGTVLKDYEKTQRYYKKRDNDIYSKLKHLKDTAIVNAAKLNDFDIDSPESAKAEIYKIFDLLEIGIR